MDDKENQLPWHLDDIVTVSSGMYDPDPWSPSLTVGGITGGISAISPVPNGGYITSGIGSINLTDPLTTSTISVTNPNWGATNLSDTYMNSGIVNNSGSGQIHLTGENADIKVNGESLLDVIKTLQNRLNVLVPNKALEAEWDELRELGERYRQLEKEFEEKSKAWAALKKE